LTVFKAIGYSAGEIKINGPGKSNSETETEPDRRLFAGGLFDGLWRVDTTPTKGVRLVLTKAYAFIYNFPVSLRRSAMKVTPTELRKDLYNLLDHVIETGKPVKIERKGITLKIVIDPPAHESKLDNLKTRNTINGDPEDIVHMDWSEEINLDFP